MNTADRNRIVETPSRASNQLTFGTVVTQQRVGRLQKLLGYYVGMVRTRNICNTQKPHNFTTNNLKDMYIQVFALFIGRFTWKWWYGYTYSDSKNYLVTMFKVQSSKFIYNCPTRSISELRYKSFYRCTYKP